jgi:hypothetical protein
MADIKKSVNLLPEYLRTDKNSKFLSSTIDQLIQTPQVERINAYVGSKITPNFDSTTDFYLDETSSLRNNYSLEPALIFRDSAGNVTGAVAYNDLVNELGVQGSKTSNLDTLFRSKFYSYDPLIDWDKLVNFTNYYWMPVGPEVIILNDEDLDVNDIIGQESYTMSNGYDLSNGMRIAFLDNTVQVEYRRKEFIVEGVGSSIKLVDLSLLSSVDRLTTVYNETFDSTEFDDYPFDSDKKLPLTPDYITINRASQDLNPWSRYNRWFHKEVVEQSAIIATGKPAALETIERAKRPIIEFRAGLQLYNFGAVGIRNVDLIDTVTTNAMGSVDGSIGYHVDGVLLQQGNRVIFNADEDDSVRGKIYEVDFDLSGDVPILHLIEPDDTDPSSMDSIGVVSGNDFYSTSWYYDLTSRTWKYAQQHDQLNQAPLFDLFTNDGVSYTEISEFNSFTGNKVFGYEVGTGSDDPILGFPLKYKNQLGTGSYLFKNYFMEDSINVVIDKIATNRSTAITFLKINDSLVNVWAEAVDYQIPILEIYVTTEDTYEFEVSCLDKPYNSGTNPISVRAFVDGIEISITTTITPSTITVTSSELISANTAVLIKVLSDLPPNQNGFYETPIGLTNNPLNGTVPSLTLGELGDHLSTMVNKLAGYTGSNLRDLDNYARYGTRLVVNANPISFAQVFLGKKEHNLVDAIRQAGVHYTQFKLNFLNAISYADAELSPSDAVDSVIKFINKAKDLKALYQRSDMLGYGENKTVRSFTVSSVNNKIYPIGIQFDLTRLSFNSVIVRLNGDQLVAGYDYTFDYVDETVSISSELAIGDVIEIEVYLDTLGCYIPPTPSKLGLYPSFVPEIFEDDSYVGDPVLSIRGHDGSISKAYGDYRDDIILELEKRIFNNIKVSYNKELFDIVATQPGAFRQSKYLIDDLNSILVGDFSKWAGIYNIDAITNDSFDDADPKTWNYTGATSIIDNSLVNGHWRNLFKFYYDTDRPHTHPWEMLGFFSQPSWWEDLYGTAPYTSANTALWQDLADGKINGVINPLYARPGLLSIIPVDGSGNLISPAGIVTENSYQEKQVKWSFGDQGPAETSWRRSSAWPFAINAAAALLDPSTYASTLYDVSRTSINPLGQVSYTIDDLYLDPRKLFIDGEDNTQIAGYGVYVVEKGRSKNLNYIDELRQDLDFLNSNLFHKLGGFASKEKLQITIDSINPDSTSPGVILPPEDYSLILNSSNPIKSARISGVIVQKSNGKFVVKGYDTTNPYFEIFKPIKTNVSGVVKVGGMSEHFSDWSNIVDNGNKGLSSVDKTSAESVTTRYYKQGQLIRYNNRFYRVKVGHNAESTFDSSLYQVLPELPVVGGATAQLPSRYESVVTQIPYGTEFTTVQEVYDLILGYGAFLESQGFIFDEFNGDLNEVLNWKFAGKEFLFWTTQNWANNNLITLSPFANYLKYSFPNSVVDNILNNKYEYSLLKADGKPYPMDSFTMSRDGTVCSIKTTDQNEGIFFAVLNAVQKEHAMVFNNYTMFNDIIYDVETGYKQRRIKLSGFRTKNWNGDLFSPGFVYDDVKISDWLANEIYLPGDVVRYNGRYYESLEKISRDTIFDFNKWDQLTSKPVSQLLPNFDYKINQFEDFYSLDIDNFDFGQQQLAQHLTGYTQRTYLNSIFTNPISQYKFYQGFIKDKGTKNAIDKLSKATQFTNKGAVSYKEEWAFRVGHYGSFLKYNEVEFPLTEGTSLENPYVVKFVDSIPSDANPLVNYVTSSTMLLTPLDFVPANTFGSYAGTWADNNLKLTTAGYVRPDDITSTAYNKNSLLDIANNSAIQNGDTIWLGFLENGDWTVYRYINQLAKVTGVFVSSPGIDITFVTDAHHGLNIGDVVSVVRFNNQVNGVYLVTSVPELNQFTVSSTLTSIENEPLLSYGTLYKFESARYADLASVANVTDLIKLSAGDKIWVDSGIDGKWAVYEKIKNYDSLVVDTSDTPPGQRYGTSIYASDDTNIGLVSEPGWRTDGTFNWGRVKVYNKINGSWIGKYDYLLNSSQKTYCSISSSTQFGYSLQYDQHKKLYITGAPEATYIRSALTSGTVVLSTGTGTVKSFVKEGLVKISSRNEDFSSQYVDLVLVNPYATSSLLATGARFGHSIYIDQVPANTSTSMLVGAPGVGTGAVYAYQISLNETSEVTTASIVVHSAGLVVNSTSSVSLATGSQWGHKIAGSNDGTVIAIGAPGYSTSTGIVQIFNEDLQWVQTITSPFGQDGKFGYDIAVSYTNQYLIVSAPEYKTPSNPYGKVVVYSRNDNGQYELLQIIDNPLSTDSLKFGYSLSINKDENILGIGALGKNRNKEQKFDESIDVGQTTFDSDSTKFYETILDSGTVYLYNKLGNLFVQADELNDVNILPGSRYGSSVVVTNDSVFVGAPSGQSNTDSTDADLSRLYLFNRIDANANSWKLLRSQEDTVDVDPLKRVVLINTLKEEITEYLDIVDPIKGKIVGLAEQELKYKAAFDPATYSIGVAGSIVNTETNWLDEHIGELWWDLSTAKYMWYEQGDEIFRKNNWGRLFPGASIDVYEWVKSDLLPSEWAALADTTEGLTKGISGQPKYPDNSIVSVKQLFNNVTGSFENVYYFWVKNKVTLPGIKNRRLSSYQVASYIADPVGNGLKCIEVISPSAVAFANVQPSLISDRITANIAIDNGTNIPKHTEWLLLNENSETSMPNALLEKKLIDSLLGRDSLGNAVPATNLTSRNRYGIGIRPQQTLFKNRLEALRNLISFANSVLAENRIVGSYSFENLNKKEEIPVELSYEYDLIVEDLDTLDEVFTLNYVRGQVECYADNGKLKSVIITDPGFGYTIAPKINISSSSETPAEIVTEIDSQGRIIGASIVNPGFGFADGLLTAEVRPHTVIVQVNSDYGNRWTKHSFNYENRTWVRTQTQKYNTPLYWTTINWVASEFNTYKSISYTIDNLYDIDSVIDIVAGEYVKVKNIGDGSYAVLERVNDLGNFIPYYNIVYRENGTIRLLDTLWDYDSGKYSYDAASLEETLYDQIPDMELYYILMALKNNIFINSLKVNWNLFFFTAVKFALTEQKLIDWAFKTSFINVVNDVGTLDQQPVYKLNNERYFENYIEEIKPYRTKIRSYSSVYNSTDNANVHLTDFDLPSYYNSSTGAFEVVEIGNPLLDSYPWKSWNDNYKFYVSSIEVGHSGAGYTQVPTVIITAAPGDSGSGAEAKAYIRNGELYKVVVTNSGSGYVAPPIVTIDGGGPGVTEVATVSVILANDNIRKNIIGLKFDRTSVEGDLVDVDAYDEWVCDGSSDKFTLTWLANPDKSTIVPLLDGKLIFSTDYTIEYYQVKVSPDQFDVAGAFPKSSWDGERVIDHRYRYFINTENKQTQAGYTRYYAKFVFLNQVPSQGQVFKITYKKSFDLYNAVDRIENLYNPTDDMPGNELSLLMKGTEYSETQVTGLLFNQTPKWDSTGTGYDSAPWGDYLSSYATANLIRSVGISSNVLTLDSVDGIEIGQTVSVAGSTSTHFKDTAVVTDVDENNNKVYLGVIDTSELSGSMQITSAYSTSTSSGSMVTIRNSGGTFRNFIKAGDLVKISGVDSLYGYGVGGVSVRTRPVASGTIGVYIGPPNYAFPGARQATGTAIREEWIFDGSNWVLTDNVTTIRIDDPGMGYTSNPTIYLTGAGVVSQGNLLAYLDSGYNQTRIVVTCTDRTLQFRTGIDLSSTTTTYQPWANISVVPVIQSISSSAKLLDSVTQAISTSYVASIKTLSPYDDVSAVRVRLDSTEIASTSTNTVWYSIISSTDSKAVVELRSVSPTTSSELVSAGTVIVDTYGNTELEFYASNSNYNILDTILDGGESLGYRTTDYDVVGNNFLNPQDSYAPEECVPGYARDSLGISVFTVGNSSSPIVQTGAFGVQRGEQTTARAAALKGTPAGIMVYGNGQKFDRVTSVGQFTTSNQYVLYNDEITVPAQSFTGRIGYTTITVGSDVTVDSNYVSSTLSEEGDTIAVSGLMQVDEVMSAYVLLDGRELPLIEGNVEDTEAWGYKIEPTASNNNRVCARLYNLPPNNYFVEAWFFDKRFPKFNRVNVESRTITTATSQINLYSTPSTIEPVSEEVLVEKILTNGNRYRMLPPWASYHKVQAGQITFAIDSKNSRPGVYNLDNVKVYRNGVELRPGYDFVVNAMAETVTLTLPYLATGDAIAITPLIDYDYRVEGNKLLFTTPVTSATIQITSFTDHDNMMLRTERFVGDYSRLYELTFPVINDNYVWVTVNNKPLISGYDFKVLEDQKTIELSEFIEVGEFDQIVVTVVNPLSTGDEIIGFRVFKDIFDRQHFRRISSYFGTRLKLPLTVTDNEITVEDGAHLFVPNPALNLPGVVYIDGERIEYRTKNGNVLSDLRRGTLGTSPALFSDVGTQVLDQSARQNITTENRSYVQHIPTQENVTTYAISTASNTGTVFSVNTTTSVGDGITLIAGASAVDQVEVYFGGRRLRKNSLVVHDKSLNYYDTVESRTTLPPEFTITTSTQELQLNIDETITTGTQITVVMKKGALWADTSSTSLLSSVGAQAEFLRFRPAALPDISFYGGDKVLIENTEALTDENGEPLEGY